MAMFLQRYNTGMCQTIIWMIFPFPGGFFLVPVISPGFKRDNLLAV